jgi:hypothetical protein
MIMIMKQILQSIVLAVGYLRKKNDEYEDESVRDLTSLTPHVGRIIFFPCNKD